MIILSRHLRKLVFLGALSGFVLSRPGLALNDETPMLRPKYKVEESAPEPPVLRPKHVHPLSQDGVNDEAVVPPKERPSHEPPAPQTKTDSHPYSLSILAETPLVHQNTFDGRFQAYGMWAAISIPLFDLPWEGTACLETGPSFMYSSLVLLQPSTSFNHIYLQTPIRFRAVFPAGQKWEWEAAVGLQVKWFGYDSRPTTDGGFKFVSPLLSNIDPDFALGLSYRVSGGMKLRVTAGYLFLGIGTEFDL